MIAIHAPEDLDRANILLAWSFASTMTTAHFEELCRVTVAQLRRDAAPDVRGTA